MDQKKYVVENINWSLIDIFCCGHYYSSAEIDSHVQEVHENDGAAPDEKKDQEKAEVTKNNAKEKDEAVHARNIVQQKDNNEGSAATKKRVEELGEGVTTRKIVLGAHEKDGAASAKKPAKEKAVVVAAKKIFACTVCGKTFKRRYDRNQHIQTFHGALGMVKRSTGVHSSRRSSIPCRMNNCAMLFGSPIGLKRHLNHHKKLDQREPNKKPVSPPMDLPLLIKKKKLGNDGKSRCAICGKHVKILSSHMKIIHRIDGGPKGSGSVTSKVTNVQSQLSSIHGPTSEANHNELEHDIHPEVEVVGSVEAPEPLQGEENYSLDHLKSDASSDDEYEPKKDIPKWADGTLLSRALKAQWYACPNLDHIFEGLDTEENVLKDMFSYQKKRFNKRTSSAQWESIIPKSFKQEPQ